LCWRKELPETEAEFGNKLTQRAREIGLEKSVFTNSNGLPDPNEKMTNRELAMLARHIILTYRISISSLRSPISPGTRSGSKTAIHFWAP
jgi:D-alanyl-D-alanine carboxypeptidase